MNEKEIAELRRRFRADKSNIARVCGCCVNEKREIISRFDQSLALMGQEDAGRVLGLLRKSLSGTLDRNLVTFRLRRPRWPAGRSTGCLWRCATPSCGMSRPWRRFFSELPRVWSWRGTT